MKTLSALSLCLLLCLGAGTLRATEIKVGTRWPELRSSDGKVFWDVKFTFVTPNEVRFMHTGGISALQLSELALPEDVTVTATAPPVTAGPLGAMMNAEERKSSGIDKLSAEEQAALAKWMTHTVSDVLKVAMEKQGTQPATFRLPANAEPPPPTVTVLPAQPVNAASPQSFGAPGASPALSGGVPVPGQTFLPPVEPAGANAPPGVLLPPAPVVQASR